MSSIRFNEPFNILAPAKLNLRLKITGRRPDGYHELVSIMVPVDLFDQIELKFIEEPRIEITCRGFSAPADESNLVWRAAEAFFNHTGWGRGLSMSLTKRIPVAAGLGGGSSDAAAVLMALNETPCGPLSQKLLSELALKLGADVPFFLHRSPCVARGIGEILDPIQKWPKLFYVIVMPNIAVSTAWVYETLDRRLLMPGRDDSRELELTTDDYYCMIRNLEKMPMSVCALLENDLEQVTVSRFPIIREIKQALRNAGAIGALMSGSGPSVFGIFESEAMATRAKTILDATSLGQVYVVNGITSWGVVKW